MIITSWNINGLRSVARHGFSDWLQTSDIDILCVQEIKLNAHQLIPELAEIPGYHSVFSHASTPGYAGVGIYSKKKPKSSTKDVLGLPQAIKDGRTLLTEFDGFSVLNIYMPHGARDKSKLGYKLQMYDALLNFLKNYTGQPLIIAGDFNVARDDIDLARPKQNRNSTMFTKTERDQLDQIATLGYTDSFRYLNPTLAAYTWWPYLAGARERNIGWRIDYIWTPREMTVSIISAATLPNITGSDHGPTTTIIELS